MELLQSALLRYWEFEPEPVNDEKEDKKEEKKGKAGKEEVAHRPDSPSELIVARTIDSTVTTKKTPVIFFDEAHKLPALIQAEDAMKALLDSFLVLTKQVSFSLCYFSTIC